VKIMNTIVARLVDEAPEHEILPKAINYDLRALRVNWTHEITIVEIEVSTHEAYKILKFSDVEELYIPGGELISGTLLSIKNLANCQDTTHYIPPIRVGGTSTGSHVLKFWANAVEEISTI
jgi:hypothetical protein